MMLCLKAETLGDEMYSSRGAIPPVNLGSSIRRLMRKVARGGEGSPHCADPTSSSLTGDGAAACFDLEDQKSSCGGSEGRHRKLCCYRSQLEQEVQILQKQLQEEIDLHLALANVLAQNAAPLSNSPTKIPDEIQELLDNISTLDIAVTNLEKELVTLHLHLCNERIERRIAEAHLGSPLISPESPSPSSGVILNKNISSFCVSNSASTFMPSPTQEDVVSGCTDSQSITDNRSVEKCGEERSYIAHAVSCFVLGRYSQCLSTMLFTCHKNLPMHVPRLCNATEEETEIDTSIEKLNENKLNKKLPTEDLCNYPNKLSEEMVQCMRNIFICLSGSADFPCSEGFQSSPVDHLSSSSFISLPGFSIMTSVFPRQDETHQSDEVESETNSFEPYGINDKMSCGNRGCYLLAAEVSWMCVRKAPLQFATKALERFRLFVEQLINVNPGSMSRNQKLAFWINVYNALMMHAYLAFGVPASDVKLFSLMQKASYTVGGQSFSAADIEYVILKMKPPMYRQQLAQCLAFYKFKISAAHREYSVDATETLAVFALSCGMYSSPAVRIYTAENVQEELQSSMRGYIQASIGLSDKGKLLVPELVHSFATGIVEDSLLIDWICRYLSPGQVTAIRDSKPPWKQRLLGVRSFSIIPFDLRFRYLFLPDKTR